MFNVFWYNLITEWRSSLGWEQIGSWLTSDHKDLVCNQVFWPLVRSPNYTSAQLSEKNSSSRSVIHTCRSTAFDRTLPHAAQPASSDPTQFNLKSWFHRNHKRHAVLGAMLLYSTPVCQPAPGYLLRDPKFASSLAVPPSISKLPYKTCSHSLLRANGLVTLSLAAPGLQ